jgi:hypothetical protein
MANGIGFVVIARADATIKIRSNPFGNPARRRYIERLLEI